MDTKAGSIFMWHTRDTFRSKGRHGLKMREWKKLFHANENESWGSNISVRQNICLRV